jgi:hypothetical protein
MNWKNIWEHPKTSVAGVLLAIVTIVPILQGIDWSHLNPNSVIGLCGSVAVALLGLLGSDSKSSVDSGANGTQKVGCFALIVLLLVGTMTTGCNAQSVAQDIVNWTPTVESTATTVGTVVAGLDPANALLIAAAVTGFNAAAQLLSNQAQTYLNNPNATALQQLQAQALSFQQNVNAALLQALKISNPGSQQKVIAAIQGLATALTAVLGLISTIKGNTLAPSTVVAPITTAQVLPLMNRDAMVSEVATHYDISRSEAAERIDVTRLRLAAVGL